HAAPPGPAQASCHPGRGNFPLLMMKEARRIMDPHPPSGPGRVDPLPLSDADESLLAQVVDELTARVQRGEEPDIDPLIRQHPALADELRSLWATVWVTETLARD